MSQVVNLCVITPLRFIKSLREQSPRSKHINDLVERIKAEMVDGSTVLLQETLANYIHPDNMDLALTTINLFRFPFNTTMPPGNDYNNLRYRRTLILTNSWNIIGYLTEVLSNWKRLHELLEFADLVNQLAFVFASVNQAELYWNRMFRLYSAEDSEDVVPFLANMLRRRMLQARFQNPPGKKPTDLDGNPVDPVFFARVQRAFWLHEFTLRRRILNVGWSNNQIPIPGGENPAHILEGFLQRPSDVDVGAFLAMVDSQRFVGTLVDHGIKGDHVVRLLYKRLFRWHTIAPLGIQCSAFCLPTSSERYSMQLLFQIAAVNHQSRLFWRRYDFKSPFWFDEWFEKYPVSGPIENISIGTDHSRLEREEGRQQD